MTSTVKTRTLTAVLAVLGMAVALWLVSQDSTPEPPPRMPAEPAGTREHRGTRRPHRADVEQIPLAQPEDEPAADVAATAPEIEMTAGVIRLRGVVAGTNGSGIAGARVEVRAIRDVGWGSQTTSLGADTATDGTFALDVAPLFAGKHTVARLAVEVDHPDHLVRTEFVEIPAQAEHPPSDLSVQITLDAAAFASAAVVDEEAAALDGVAVGMFIQDDDHNWVRMGETVTDNDGRFRLRVQADIEQFVFAAVAGRVPGFVRFTPEGLAPVDLGQMTLRDGVSLSGRVVAGDLGPLAETKVETWTRWLGTKLRVGTHSLTYGEGKVGHFPTTVTADKDGRYTVAGLHSGTTRVVLDVPGAALSVRHALDRDVEAPANDAHFVVTVSRLVVEVRDGEHLVPNAHMTIQSGAGMNDHATDENGRAALLVLPGETYEVVLHLEGFERIVRTVPGPPMGLEHVERIDLVRFRARPTLSVRLSNPAGTEIAKAAFWFFAEGSSGPITRRPDLSRNAQPTDNGAFQVNDVEPGRYRVVIKPGNNSWGGEGHYLPIETDIVLPAEGVVERSYEVTLGGRLSIGAVRSDGESVVAGCTVRSAQGDIVDAMFMRGRAMGRSLGKGTNLLEPPIPPGWYRIEVENSEYSPRTVSALVERGKTTEVKVRLAPR